MARFESFEWTDRGRANGVNLNGDVLSWWEAPEPSNRSVGGGQSYQDVSDFLENGPALGAPKRIVQKLLDALGAPEVEWEP